MEMLAAHAFQITLALRQDVGLNVLSIQNAMQLWLASIINVLIHVLEHVVIMHSVMSTIICRYAHVCLDFLEIRSAIAN